MAEPCNSPWIVTTGRYGTHILDASSKPLAQLRPGCTERDFLHMILAPEMAQVLRLLFAAYQGDGTLAQATLDHYWSEVKAILARLDECP